MPPSTTWEIWVLSVLAGALIGYVLGYVRRKRENLATHEDIAKLGDEVRAVSTTTKEIGALWDRQKRWEMKREVLFSAARRLTDIEDALLTYDLSRNSKNNHNEMSWNEDLYHAMERWGKASQSFDETRLLVAIVCARETVEAFEDLGLLTKQIAIGVRKKDPSIYTAAYDELTKRLSSARSAMRRELETDVLL